VHKNARIKNLGRENKTVMTLSCQAIDYRGGPGCLHKNSASQVESLPRLSCRAEWQQVKVGLIRGASVNRRVRPAAVVEKSSTT
jgi:hypothetical protein